VRFGQTKPLWFADSHEVLVTAHWGYGDQHVDTVDDDEEIPLALALRAFRFPKSPAFGHI
jgi:hypothetical protein